MNILNKLEEKLKEVNLAAVIDHSGRAGNAFFLTIFDQHPEVLACPLLHYTYSYIITEFGTKPEIIASDAKNFLTEKSYFRLLYHFDNKENKKLIYRMGVDNPPVNQNMIVELTDAFFKDRHFITRQTLAVLPFLIYGISCNRCLEKIKFVLVSDAISLRSENVMTGFSGQVIDTIIEDFPNSKLISLVRDPRATFASPRHQFVNWFDNMYALKFGTTIKQFKNLIAYNFSMDNTCVYLFWLLYLAQSAKTIFRKKNQYATHFLTIKNEDLNLNFINTITAFINWMDIKKSNQWDEAPYIPTILGQAWQGTGAYNNRYQYIQSGRLKNDSDDAIKLATGPNQHVTERWKNRLSKREVHLIERLFKDEMNDLDYKIFYDHSNQSDFILLLKTTLLPFEGELPSFQWLRNSLQISYKTLVNRLYYCVMFPPFYIISRIILFDLTLKRKFFKKLKVP